MSTAFNESWSCNDRQDARPNIGSRATDIDTRSGVDLGW